MGILLNLFQGACFLNNGSFCYCPSNVSMFLQRKSCSYSGTYGRVQSSCQGGSMVIDRVKKGIYPYKDFDFNGKGSDAFLHVQTLNRFPRQELFAKVVMVRFDSNILLWEELETKSPSVSSAIHTIRYLNEAGAKVILVSDWSKNLEAELLRGESVADFLSLVLQLKVVTASCTSVSMGSKMKELEKGDLLLLENLSEFKEESANCSKFAQRVSLGVDIFVNDALSQSHRVLASTVGVARFCYASLAGFHFEEGLYQLKKVVENNKKPYVTIIGGGNFLQKAAALQSLASICDGLVFVGMMAFQIMHALGLLVPSNLVEYGALKEASNLIQFAQYRNIPILYPKEFLCMSTCLPGQSKILPAHGILDGWVPVDLAPNSLDEIEPLLLKSKKILWIGPVKFSPSNHDVTGVSKVAIMLDKLSQDNCDITILGKMACKLMMRISSPASTCNVVESASVMWELLKGKRLPGVMALDKAFPFKIDWDATFCNPAKPLAVDIGSGNGFFLLGMAHRRTDLNFLGLEMNEKLVGCCLGSVHQSGIRNVYFIATNATSTFRSIIAGYPGNLVLVSIQCPNPDFNRPEHRWRMVQRSLVEAVADLLAPDGKVFLQSDIEAVSVRMKEQFMKYGKGKLAVSKNQDDAKVDQEGWLKENPFGVRSDWEQHVIDRGAPMYRLMLSKSL